jgi:beta-glucanase (GH16 family)
MLLLLCSGLLLISCDKEKSSGLDPDPTPNPAQPPTKKVDATAVCNYNYNENTLLEAGWTKFFSDDFDSNLGKWEVMNGQPPREELQYYQAKNLQVSGGNLQIISKKETVYDTAGSNPRIFNYTSGGIISRAEFSAKSSTPKVRFVASIKLPKGFGNTSTFYSFGSAWPTQGQINFLVARSEQPKTFETTFYYGTSPNQNLVTDAITTVNSNLDLTDCYHVYEMEWTQNSLTTYLDGKLVETKTGGAYIPSLFGKSHRIELASAIKASFFYRPQIQPGTMLVDWVKVYTSN